MRHRRIRLWSAGVAALLSAGLAGQVLAASALEDALVEEGSALFGRNCAFCHGRDAMGGEGGPNLARSLLVSADKEGERIAVVVREGRLDKKMPAFTLTTTELLSIAAFLHSQEAKAASMKDRSAGVETADLQSGSAADGEAYFNGAGGCTRCHSANGDLAGIANRYVGLKLELRMLYPRDVKSRVTVTPVRGAGESIPGTLQYLDEFTLGMHDMNGNYHSWRLADVRYVIDAPLDAHVEQFDKYTDKDIHDLMAYLQTLKVK